WQRIRSLALAHSGRWGEANPSREPFTSRESQGFWGSPAEDFGVTSAFPLESTTALAFQLTPTFQELLRIWQLLECGQADTAEAAWQSACQNQDWIPLESIRVEAALLCCRGDYLGAYELISGTTGFRPLYPLCRLAIWLGREPAIAEYVEKRFADLTNPSDRFWATELLLGAGRKEPVRTWLNSTTASTRTWRSDDWWQVWALETNPEESESRLSPTSRHTIAACLRERQDMKRRARLQRWCRNTWLHSRASSWSRQVASAIADLFQFPREERLAAGSPPDPVKQQHLEKGFPQELLSKDLRAAITASRSADTALEAFDQLVHDAGLPVLLAVMGEFNAGKSTLINALLGTNALPRGNLPTTPLPCTLRYGDYPLAVLIANDGQRQYLPIEQLPGLFGHSSVPVAGSESPLVDPRGQLPFALRQVREIEIVLPIELLKHFWIIDTPGLNSGNTSHQRATEALVRRADAVLWVFDANQAGRASELNALHRLVPPHALRLIAVNRLDEIDPDETEDVLADVRRALGDERLPLFAVSAKQALLPHSEANRSGIDELRRHLLERIGPDERSFKERSVQARIRLLLEQVREKEAQEREAVQDYPNRLKHELETLCTRSQRIVSDWFARHSDEIRRELEPFCRAWSTVA
ncbi:MAG TPA: dynamin family protein, partial [Candidatus Ozemobacteraceae bacterium]|nr:dynamin family protein [Candidatus Ozemobacteraceae bacterium]